MTHNSIIASHCLPKSAPPPELSHENSIIKGRKNKDKDRGRCPAVFVLRLCPPMLGIV